MIRILRIWLLSIFVALPLAIIAGVTLNDLILSAIYPELNLRSCLGYLMRGVTLGLACLLGTLNSINEASVFSFIFFVLGVVIIVKYNRRKMNSNPFLELGQKWITITATEVQAMINSGADVHAKSTYGETPLHAAAKYGNAKVISALIKAGADVNVQDIIAGTPLHEAAGFGKAEVISVLIKAGADINAKDKDGWTPLNLAESRNHEDAVSALEDAGAK